MSKKSRKGYEFDDRIIQQELMRWHTKNPAQPTTRLEVHHILPVHEAKKRGVPRQAIKSQQNAVAVPKEFHKRVHRETTEETYSALAEALKKLWLVLPIGSIIAIISYWATMH